ncbi:MAG: hypothetical protein ABI624_09230 [Casimicrobiaceae bacterium]
MDRRDFLKTSVPALAVLGLGISGCGDDVTPEAPKPAFLPFPPLKFITRDPKFTDYRPAVDSTGTKVVFERTPFPNPNEAEETVLYLASAIGTPNQAVERFLKVPPNPPPQFPFSQTRPDWSWANQQIAFSGAPSGKATIETHIVDATGVGSHVVPNTLAHIYPIWTSDGTQLIVYNNSDSAKPVRPVTSLITPTGTIVVPNLNGRDLANPPVDMFGGFAAPRPSSPTQIAYAGQPALASWGIPAGETAPAPVYNQDNNYVFLNTATSGGYTSAPLDAGAPVTNFVSAFQGRAPYWSPDGNYVVFESSRAGGYALFLANVTKRTPPVQLTESTYWAQHAKFLPGGTSIVFTALQTPSVPESGPRGIAIIDIAAFL